jgi:hypothetical protein
MVVALAERLATVPDERGNGQISYRCASISLVAVCYACWYGGGAAEQSRTGEFRLLH